MKEEKLGITKETFLLRKMLEVGDIKPAPDRIEHYSPHYEILIPIGRDQTASVILDKDAYFEIMESDEYSE